MDRYNHDLGEDTDDTDDSPLFGSFSSYSPQSRKISQTRPPQLTGDTELDCFSKKQLFRNEFERPLSQLSPCSSTTFSPPLRAQEKVIAIEKNRTIASAKNNVQTDSPNRTLDKSTEGINSSPVSASTSGESRITVVKTNTSIEGNSVVNLSTPDSSQTESDDISPQIHRKRHSHSSRDKLPRFSISIDGDYT